MTYSKYELKNNIYIAKLLSKEGIKTQKIVITLKGEVYVTLGNKYFILFTKLKREVLKYYLSSDYLKRGFYLSQCVVKLPRQIIYRDVLGENMIFSNEKLVRYICFDLSQINARIYNVCHLCTDTLVKVFDNMDKRTIWI